MVFWLKKTSYIFFFFFGAGFHHSLLLSDCIAIVESIIFFLFITLFFSFYLTLPLLTYQNKPFAIFVDMVIDCLLLYTLNNKKTIHSNIPFFLFLLYLRLFINSHLVQETVICVMYFFFVAYTNTNKKYFGSALIILKTFYSI